MSEIILYTTPNGAAKVEITYENDTFWQNQKQMADLFGVDRGVITKHLGNIFEEGELDRNTVSAEFAQTAAGRRNFRVRVRNSNDGSYMILETGEFLRSGRDAAIQIPNPWNSTELKVRNAAGARP